MHFQLKANTANRSPTWARAMFLVAMIGGSMACVPVGDNPAARQKVLEAVQAGGLAPAEGFDVYTLPDELKHASQGGEIVVREDEHGLTITIFDFRGLNHYTGWIYRADGVLTEEPSGNEPFQVQRVEGNWFRVEAG